MGLNRERDTLKTAVVDLESRADVLTRDLDQAKSSVQVRPGLAALVQNIKYAHNLEVERAWLSHVFGREIEESIP